MKLAIACLAIAWSGCGVGGVSVDISPIALGEYDIRWTCEKSCFTDSPFQYQDTLTITGESLIFSRSHCGFGPGCNPIEATIWEYGTCLVAIIRYGDGVPVRVCREDRLIRGRIDYIEQYSNIPKRLSFRQSDP